MGEQRLMTGRGVVGEYHKVADIHNIYFSNRRGLTLP